MLFPSIGTPRTAVSGIIDSYAREKGLILSPKHKNMLMEYLIPYTKMSLYIPSSHEIRALARISLQKEDQDKIETLLIDSTAEIRKGLYFLFKIKNRIKPTEINTVKPTETEEKDTFTAAKNASIGVYMAWFREIAEGRSDLLKRTIHAGLFDISYSIYKAGEAYLYLSKRHFDESPNSTRPFYSVIKRHLDRYRESIYGERVEDLFEFYTKHMGRMKWLKRLCHLSQEILSYEESTPGTGCIIEFTEKISHSPWTREFAQEVLEEYRRPLSEEIVRWMNGHPTGDSFIREGEGNDWSRFTVVEKEVPPNIPYETAQRILYIGRTRRILGLLGEIDRAGTDEKAQPMKAGITGTAAVDGTAVTSQFSGTVQPSPGVLDRELGYSGDLSQDRLNSQQSHQGHHSSLPSTAAYSSTSASSSAAPPIIPDVPNDGIFNRRWIDCLYDRAYSMIRNRLFVAYGVDGHLNRIRDIFFLFRSDFSFDLFLAVSYSYSPSVIDEVLDRSFGDGVSSFVDVRQNGFSLIYKEVFPYSLIVGDISGLLESAFELFWNLRMTIYRVLDVHRRNKSPRTYSMAARAGEIEYYYFERVVRTLWSFNTLPGEVLYNPEKISKKVEDILYHLVSTCKETCTVSILQKIQELLQEEMTDTNIKTVENLLMRI